MPPDTPLPILMVAPTGARRTKKDHPSIPLSIEEIINAAKSCMTAGADGIHIHVRDQNNAHVLDAGLYKEVLKELAVATPALTLQITTEAVGRYSPQEQRDLVKAVRPASVSVSIAEMLADDDHESAIDFYSWCEHEGIAVQHVLYGQDDLTLLSTLINNPLLTKSPAQLLFVLGRYAINQESSPDDLIPFTQWLNATGLDADWAVCAFGRGETDCLIAAHKLGGKLRVGFENSLWHKDGTLAADNAERVAEIVESMSDIKQLKDR